MAVSRSKNVLRADLVFPEKDKALREDVHRLGELVGDLVQEQAGEALFDLVEAARRASIAHREGDGGAFAELRTLLAALAPTTARDFIRAFSTYFQVVNMAEQVHRIRRRRAYAQDAGKPQPFGFRDVLQRLKAEGVDADEMERIIAGVCIEPVFMSHPTEVTRRTLLRKQQNIARHLLAMLDPYMTPQEVASELRQIRLEMTTGWQTEEFPGEQMHLGDEAEHVLFFLTDVLYRIVPQFYEAFDAALADTFVERGARLRVPTVLKFSSWVGGDMGNDPSVTAKSMRETLARQRALVLDLYYRETRELAQHLSQSENRVGVSEELRAKSLLYAGHFPQAAHSVPARHRKMPYRVFLRLVGARLQATYDDEAFPYESPDEFIEDIELVADSLRANRGRHAGLFLVQRLLRRAQSFGFHLATLDVRQDALVHRRVVGEVLDEPGWLELASAARTARVKEALERRESPLGPLSSEARRTLGVFQAIAHSRRKYGRAAIGQYVVSMAHGPDDVLSVLLLAKWGHLGPKGGDVPLDIAPLFETAEDLENAGEIMRGLLADAHYRKHLESRGNEQMVMVGYSDGNKEGELVSARWSLHQAQRHLIATMRELGVKLTLFHGRGGTVSRSGGRLTEGLLAVPQGAITGRLRMTEQSEMINAKYGIEGIAMRSLEQTLSSVLWLSAREQTRDPRQGAWRDIMAQIAADSRAAYRRLIYDTGDFPRYFRDATPIDVIERLNTVFQPVDRRRRGNIEDVRATPWVFAWTQTRCILPGWFGLATGLSAALEKHGQEELGQMLIHWPFFRVLIGDVEVVLAKADLDIASRYSQLAGDLHGEFFPIIKSEYDRCVDLVLALTGHKELLEEHETLRRSIRLRNPYMDPMSFLQVDLLERWRKGGRQDDAMLQALMVSVNGIAHGMQISA
ncbi:MAG TPA: phosphoenolpyruvate carboxylase [Gammaproteobacteria bacterium]|nr:phosphoenolpyruvate carboxylase [Gammaproteobacteria bacterium]